MTWTAELACVLLGPAESQVGGKLLLVPAWDEVPVHGSGVIGLGSATRHAGEGWRSPELTCGWIFQSGMEVQWTGKWLGFRSDVKLGGICGVGVGQLGLDPTWRPGRSHIRSGYGLGWRGAR